MFTRLANGWNLAKSSWGILRSEKQLLLFPLLSGVALILVFISFLVPIAVIAQNGGLVNANGQLHWWFYLVAFLFYFVNYFVIVFCNAALTACALIRLNGEQPTLGQGFRASFSRLPQIAAWALVSATVGILLAAIEKSNEKVGYWVRLILGAAWSIMTFFVIPILVVEKVGPIEAVKRSMGLMKKTWGEALGGNFGMGLLIFLLSIPAFLLFFGGMMLLAVAHEMMLGYIVLGLALAYFLGLSIVSSALHYIYLSALYQYAAFERVPEGFDAESFTGAFSSKQPKEQRLGEPQA